MPITSTYLLEYTPAEADRLLAMAGLMAPEVRSACGRAGLQPGGRAIDVGCGPLGALTTLREMVGPDGFVVGLDANADAVEAARAIVDRLGFSNIQVVNADINDPSAATGEPGLFDLAFCRLVLMHQSDPVQTMTRITELLRPGGALVAFDMLRGPLLDPSCPSVDRAWQLLWDGMRSVGAHPETSRRYASIAAEAGLEIVSQRGVFLPVPPVAAIGETTRLLRAASAAIIAREVATGAEIETLLHQMQVEQSVVQFATTPIAVELVARKPTRV
jgi:SAM-dependent methyltransferase